MKFVSQLLAAQRARTPLMEPADVYKLLHQAALGPAHAVHGDDARARLHAEAAALGPGADAPLVEPISPDGRLARVHLRPWVAAGHPLDALADAFTHTAATWVAQPDKLAKFCGCLGDLADATDLGFTREAIAPYMAAQAAAGWPSVRHSARYRDAYAPAYRVVDVQSLPDGLRPAQSAS
jgi:hypothetical protein